MWSTDGPGHMDELCKLTLMVTNIGRLMMHRRLQFVDAQLKAHGVESSLSREYALYSVKANKEASSSLHQKAPPLVEHVDAKGDF